MTTFEAPTIPWLTLSPLLVVFGAAVVGVLLEAFVPRAWRYASQATLAAAAMVASLVASVVVLSRLSPTSDDVEVGRVVLDGALAADGPAVFSWVLLSVLGLLSVMLFAERKVEAGVLTFAGQAAALPGTEAEREASTRGLAHTEVFPLALFAIGGMMLFPAANDLLTMFVALEVLSLPLYLLCGLARRRRLLSQEAAMKYFLLGAFSSGFFVYGLALVYGYAGSMNFAQIAAAVSADTSSRLLLLGGIALMAVGLLFKVGAAPFHAWTPDVYQGAPTAVTAFMAAATKVAAFGALLRLFYVAFGGNRTDWLPMVWAVAILTMVVGSVLAVSQNDVKRMLAYSSIAHAGFILTGFIGIRSLGDVAPGGLTGVSATLFYLTTYGFTTMAAFAIVSIVRDSGGETTHLARWQGLGKESPLVAGTFAFLLLAMAGIPLTSGFTGKWAVFAAAMSAGAWPVVVVAVLMSAVAAYFYVRVIVLMFFTDPVGEGPSVATPSPLTAGVIAVGTLVTLLLGIVPGALIDLLGNVGVFIR